MHLTPQQKQAIAECLNQVANAINTNPASSVALGYLDGMEDAGCEPLSISQLRELAGQMFPGDVWAIAQELDEAT